MVSKRHLTKLEAIVAELRLALHAGDRMQLVAIERAIEQLENEIAAARTEAAIELKR